MARKLRVLLVQDLANDAAALTAELRRAGHEPVLERVDSAQSFCRAIELSEWDIVISDHPLAQFSAVAALKLISDRRLDLPLIVVSNTVGGDDAVNAMKAGASDYILKNHLERLVPAIERGLREAEQRRQRKRTEEALLESAELFRKLSESSPLGILLMDNSGKCTYTNPRARTMFGLTLMETIGEGWTRAVYAEDREQLVHEWTAALRAGREFSQEFRLQARSGAVQWIHARSSPMFSESGQLTGHVATVEDITERMQAEEKLRKSEKRFRDLFESSPDAAFVEDLDGNVLDVNPAACRLHGLERGQLVGKNVLELVPPSLREQVVKDFRSFVRGELGNAESFSLAADGRAIPVELRTSRIEYAGNPAVLLHVRDITERKRLENQLLQSQKMEAIGQLAGGVAHDFNNILTAILGYSELMLRRLNGSEPLQRNAEEIRKAALRATTLTRQLLAFSRKQTLEAKVLDLGALVADMSGMLQRLIGETIELRIVHAEKLGCVKADPGQIEQVVLNLAVNARDAMPQGGKLVIETADVTVEAAPPGTFQRVPPGDYVKVSVTDTGTGMTDHVKTHMFEPFFTTKDPGKGTGLGLATCYGIVRQSGGHITVESELGRGSTFAIYLPRVFETADATMQDDGTATPASRGEGETVLIVEDEMAVRELASEVLREMGYNVLTAGDGDEALQLARGHGSQPLQLLMTDVVLPKMGGKEVAERLKAVYPDLKVLFSSGYSEDVVANTGALPPDTWYLQKPFSADGLARKVRMILDCASLAAIPH